MPDVKQSLDSLIAAAEARGVEKGKAEGEERLQKYTEAYLTEGIKRCSIALSQGRAEGAEKMRMKILDTGRFLPKNENVEGGFELRDGNEEYCSYIIVPTDNYRLLREADIPEKPPVLAPEESEQDNTTEEEYEDMRRNGGPGVKP